MTREESLDIALDRANTTVEMLILHCAALQLKLDNLLEVKKDLEAAEEIKTAYWKVLNDICDLGYERDLVSAYPSGGIAELVKVVVGTLVARYDNANRKKGKK